MSIKIQINNIKLLNTDKYELQLKLPKEITIVDQYLDINGFVYRKDGKCIEKLQYSAKSLFAREVIGIVNLDNSPGFFNLHSNHQSAKKARFDSKLHTAFLDKNDNIRIIANIDDGSHDIIVSFDINMENNIVNVYNEKLSPIKLLSLGRTGTTLFMNMLSAHPKIGVNNHFNESNISSYYLNSIKHMYPTIQKNHYGEGKANLKNIETIENGEFMEFPFITNDNWYSDIYPKKLVSFVKSTIDDYYLNIDPGMQYFIEKDVVHDPTLTLMDKLYVNSKYIFLVRDFRDMYASILNFNNKRGFRAFGMENYEKDEDYIVSLGNYCNNSFITAYEAIKDKAILIKYEDLVINKRASLKTIFDYLEIDSSSSILDEVIDKTSGKSSTEQKHMTTADVSQSIGRYKESLDSNTIKLLNKSFDRSLKYFGYEVK